MSKKPFELYVRIEDEFEKNPYEEFNEMVASRGLLAVLDFSQELLLKMLQYWLATGQPPPERLAVILMFGLQTAMAGHPSSIFAKPKDVTKPSLHPMTAWLEQNAVLYCKACKAKGWDEHPVKTISEKCGVDRKTVYRWIKKYDTVEFTDDLTREELDNILYGLESSYHNYK